MRKNALTPDRSVRHFFGAEMRRYRENAGMTLEGLAGVVHFARSHLSRIELAESIIPTELPAKLDAAFGTDGHFVRLYALAKKEVHPDRYRRLMELETQARIIHEFAGDVVPGLVQTEEYARALFRIFAPRATAEQIEEKVQARLSRQELLRATPPPDLTIVLDEAVVRRAVGGSAVMRAQLEALIEQVQAPRTTIQLLPFAHGEHALLGGSLKLMTLEDKTQAAYEESIATGTLLEDEESVSERRRHYDLIRACALSPRDTATFLRTVLEGLPDEPHPRPLPRGMG
jgi:transcriptional regulator with XRE-family HTH domain